MVHRIEPLIYDTSLYMGYLHRDDVQIELQPHVQLSFSCQVRARATASPMQGPTALQGSPFVFTRPALEHTSPRAPPPSLCTPTARSVVHHVYPNKILSSAGQIDQRSTLFYQTLRTRITIHPSDDERFETLTSKAGYNTGNGRSRSALTRAVIRAHNTREWRTLMSIVFFELSILPELKP
jgi:hypothetical protein